MALTTCYPFVSNYPHIQWQKQHVILLFQTTHSSNGSNNMLSSCFQITWTSNGSNMLSSCFQTTHKPNGSNNMLSSCFQTTRISNGSNKRITCYPLVSKLPAHPKPQTTCYPFVSNYLHIQWLKQHVILLFPTTHTSNGSNKLLSFCFQLPADPMAQTTCYPFVSKLPTHPMDQTCYPFVSKLSTNQMALITCYAFVSNYPHIQWLKEHVICLFPTTHTFNGSNNMLYSCFQLPAHPMAQATCYPLVSKLPAHPLALTTCYPHVSNYPHIQWF